MNDLRRRAVGFQSRHNGDIAFDLESVQPELFRAVLTRCPALEATLREVRRELPLPPDALPETTGHFYRLPGHTRSFCCALTESDDPFEILSAPTMIVKGTEPLLPDFPRLVQWMQVAPHRLITRRMADHFALAEGKVPGALTMAEAQREARIAAEVQAAHLRAYLDLAPMPVPLLIIPFSDDENRRCLSTLRDGLSRAAFGRIEPAVTRGLATYVYYYPTSPIRSSVWGSGGGKPLVEYVKRAFDHDLAVRRWVRLFVRLLYLGYLPFTSWSEGLGACMDFGNATIDGGICDPDSIVPMAECPDDHFLVDSLVRSLEVLGDTCVRLACPIQVVAPGLSLNLAGSPAALAEALTSHYLSRLIDAALESEARVDLEIDPRVLRVLAPGSFSEIAAMTVPVGHGAASYPAFTRSRAPRRS